MKLLDILARELKEWPEDKGCGYCVQAFGSTDVIFGGRANYFEASEVAEDNADARVTRADWQVAAEARKRVTDDIESVCVDGENNGIPFHQALYDAGYRKFEIIDEPKS